MCYGGGAGQVLTHQRLQPVGDAPTGTRLFSGVFRDHCVFCLRTRDQFSGGSVFPHGSDFTRWNVGCTYICVCWRERDCARCCSSCYVVNEADLVVVMDKLSGKFRAWWFCVKVIFYYTLSLFRYLLTNIIPELCFKLFCIVLSVYVQILIRCIFVSGVTVGRYHTLLYIWLIVTPRPVIARNHTPLPYIALNDC